MAEKRKELSSDVKNIVVSLRNEGYRLQQIADALKISRGTVYDVLVRFRKRGARKTNLEAGDHEFWIKEMSDL